MKEYVLDLNLMTIPIKTVTIIPAVRVQQESWDANSSGIGTLSTFPRIRSAAKVRGTSLT